MGGGASPLRPIRRTCSLRLPSSRPLESKLGQVWCKYGGEMYRHGVWFQATTPNYVLPFQPLYTYAYLVPLCGTNPMTS